jgi:hypothetical protein
MLSHKSFWEGHGLNRVVKANGKGTASTMSSKPMGRARLQPSRQSQWEGHGFSRAVKSQ